MKTRDYFRITRLLILFVLLMCAMRAPRKPAARAVGPIQVLGKIQVFTDLLVANDYLRGIQLYDISNPAAPAQRAFISIPGCADFALYHDGVFGTLLYANGNGPLYVYDINDPANPVLSYTINDVFPASPRKARTATEETTGDGDEGTGCACEESSSSSSTNESSSSSSSSSSATQTAGEVDEYEEGAGCACTEESSSSSSSSSEESSSSYSYSSEYSSSSSRSSQDDVTGTGEGGGCTCAEDSGSGNGTQPQYMARLTIVDGKLLVLNYRTVQVYSLAQPTTPQKLGNAVTVDSEPQFMGPGTELLILGEGTSMKCYSLSSTNTIAFEFSLTSSQAEDRAVQVGTNAYLASLWGGSARFAVYSINTNSDFVTESTNFPLPAALDVAQYEGHAYICSGSSGLKVYNVTNQNDVFLATDLSGQPAYAVSVSSNATAVNAGNRISIYTGPATSMVLQADIQ